MLRYRHRVLCLDNALQLTRGNPLGVSALMARLSPNTGSTTAVAQPQDGRPMIAGQVVFDQRERSAHLTYLLPDDLAELPELNEMVEYLAGEAGAMGAIHLLADMPENHPAFEMLRRSNFSVFCRENIWRLPASAPANIRFKGVWSKAEPGEDIEIRSLYQTVVPPLIQAAEPFSNTNTPRLVYHQQNEVMAFVQSVSGPQGILIQPVIHPSVEDVQDLFGDMIFHFEGLGKPVYIQVRSHQSWISDVLAVLGSQSSPRFAQMVKHLSVAIPAESNQKVHNRLEVRSAEPTASIVQKAVEK